MRCFWLIVVLLLASVLASAQNADSSGSGAPRPSSTVTEAHALIEKGQFAAGIEALKAMAARDPQDKAVARELALAYYKSADYLRASAYLEKVVAADADDKEAVQLLGLSYFFIGRPKNAIPLLEQVQSWFPAANVDAAYVLGISYIQTMDYERARKAFATMYGVPAESAASHLFLARMLLRQNYDPIAEAEAKKAAELDPKLPLAHYLLGELYIFKSRIPEAIKEFEAEMAINPGHAATYYRLADAYTRVMRWDDAERLLQRSLWLDATASGPYILMGKVLLKKNEPKLAVRSLDRALGMDPNNYIGHYLLGQAYRALGKAADADRELQLSEKLQAAQTRSQAELRDER